MDIEVTEAKIVKSEPAGFFDQLKEACRVLFGAAFAVIKTFWQAPLLLLVLLAVLPLAFLVVLFFWILLGILIPLLVVSAVATLFLTALLKKG